jgi:hypothetical protein
MLASKVLTLSSEVFCSKDRVDLMQKTKRKDQIIVIYAVSISGLEDRRYI